MPEFISILRWIRDIVYPQLLETNENVKIIVDNIEEVKALNTSIEDGVLPFEKITTTTETIDSLLTLNASSGDTVIVKDLNRGGTFIYDATQSAVNNNGTIFDGWIRQYSGAVNVKWFGVVDDGTDQRVKIQNVLNEFNDIYIDSGTFMINSTSLGTGLSPTNGTKIEFHKDALLKLIPNNSDSYSIINLTGTENVSLISPNIEGDRLTHTGTTGESGMGIYMRNTKNITIYEPTISECWGDGIYLGQSLSVGSCDNTSIIRPNIYLCRRQGISVVSVNGFVIDGGVIHDIAGTQPESGVDFEPNSPSCDLLGISVNNLKTYNCGGEGITIDLNHLIEDVSIVKTVSMKIINHIDDASNAGITFTRCYNPANGSIVLENCVYSNNIINGIQIRRWNKDGVLIKILTPNIINPNRSLAAATLNGAAISGYTLLSDASPSSGSGNIIIDRPSVYFDVTTGIVAKQIAFQDTLSHNVENLHIKLLDTSDESLLHSPDSKETTCSTFIGESQIYGTNSIINTNELVANTVTSNKLVITDSNIVYGSTMLSSTYFQSTSTTSSATILFNGSSLWKVASIEVMVSTCNITSDTPNVASVGAVKALYGVRFKTGSTSVLTNSINVLTSTNLSIAISFPTNGRNAVITATGFNMVGTTFDIKVTTSAGAPLSITYTA